MCRFGLADVYYLRGFRLVFLCLRGKSVYGEGRMAMAVPKKLEDARRKTGGMLSVGVGR
jgi:hypothetical protein